MPVYLVLAVGWMRDRLCGGDRGSLWPPLPWQDRVDEVGHIVLDESGEEMDEVVGEVEEDDGKV